MKIPLADSERLSTERRTFEKAKSYLKPTLFFRCATRLYAERKLLVVLLVHLFATCIVWTHYSLIKWRTLGELLDSKTSYYWLKRLVPTLIFGSKHAILLQAALIPLTMSRYSISSLSQTVVDRFVPLNQMVSIHIQLGYCMVGIVVFATVMFLYFYGSLCAAGEHQYCKGLRSEIMLTGYAITAITLVVAGTSYFRSRIPYEVFYAVHHLVFVFYAMTILHTFDNVQREGLKSRYQTFAWVSASLVFYLCDRAVLHINHRYRMRLMWSSTLSGMNGTKTVILKLKRPILFDFKPGQYAFLRLNEIDSNWHPFSIASGPSSSHLEFYIEVFAEKSWTWQLWTLLEKYSSLSGRTHLQMDFDVIGPYGSSFGDTGDFSHGLAIGSGTGIVPVLSLFKQHVRQLLHLEPHAHFINLENQEKRVMKIEKAIQERKRSVAATFVASCFGVHADTNRRDSTKETIIRSMETFDQLSSMDFNVKSSDLKAAAFGAVRSIYGVVALAFLTVLGVALIGWTVSFNTFGDCLFDGMHVFLLVTTIVFQTCFAVTAIFVWDGNRLSAYFDVAVVLATPFLDWFWDLSYRQQPALTLGQLAVYVIFVGYMTLRTWSQTVRPRHCTWKAVAKSCGSSCQMDRLDLVWVTRSACQVAEILPDIDKIYSGLVRLWGGERALRVCRVTVYVTDKDKTEVDLLHLEIADLLLYQHGRIQFERPDFRKIIEEHSLDMISTRRNSSTLLAFCGSPALGRSIHEHKLENEMVVAMTGNKKHQMEFVAESYGGVSPAKEKKRAQPSDAGLTSRTDVRYEGNSPNTSIEFSRDFASIEMSPGRP